MTAAATFMRRNPHCFDAQLVIYGAADDFEHGLLGRFDGGLIAAQDANALRERGPLPMGGCHDTSAMLHFYIT
jgi:hypothetical protein